MSARIAVWILAGVAILLLAAFNILDLFNGHRYAPPAVGTFVAAAFLIVGALIALRRPRNPIGWIYLVGVTLIAFGGSGNLSAQYAYYALGTRPGALPAVEWVVWAGDVAVTAGFGMLVFFSLLLFPDGRLPSRRWRPLAQIAVVTIALFTAGSALGPNLDPSPEIPVANPLGTPWAGPALGAIQGPIFALGLAVALACVASVFARFRAASGVERQQLKWFAFGAAGIPAVAGLSLVLSLAAPGLDAAVGDNLWPLSVVGIPIATAVAILRLRLYDIDVLINRALVYGATTALIAAAFFAGIVVLQGILRPLTNGSEIAVAVSTLASVALAQPLRSRIQSVMDRRFYRLRYDAARTLEDFSVRLRDQVAIDAVRSDLLDAVRDTVQPTHASVWLRPE